jgi:hypothetical protein
MSYKKLFWGILLVFIGVLFILKNLGWVYFDWWTIFRLWPLLLILWGISIVPVKGIYKLALSLAAIVITILVVSKFDTREPFMNFHRNDQSWHFGVDGDYFNDEDSSYSKMNQELFQSYDSTIKKAVLSFDAAAGDFRISDSIIEENLLVFQKKGDIGDYSMTSNQDGDMREINLKIQDSRVRLNKRGNVGGNKVMLYLNPEPIWDFDFDIGAANINFDLSNFRTENIKIDGGASSINLRIGDKQLSSKIKIDAGAASIVINVPRSAGVELKTETVLTSRNFQGFNKLNDGYYKTENYESSQSKIFLDIDAGVSSLTINRY